MGQFNVPFGHYKNPQWLDAENLKDCSKALKNAKLISESFEKILDKVKEGDFVYLDPPYAALNSTSKVTTFNPTGFGQDEHLRLRDFCIELDKKGVKWLQSNSASPLIYDLYKDFKILKVETIKTLNFKTNQRKSMPELIIMNYKI